jgi:hypothetical protein
MSYENVQSWRRRTKLALIEYKGGKCEKCGYSKLEYPRVFHFHHRDPAQKDFSPSSKNWAIERLKEEVDKCQLLCSNCHAEEHEIWDQEKRPVRTDLKKNKRGARVCESCNNLFKYAREDQRYCSLDCSDFSKRKAKRPSRDELYKMVWSKPTTQIASDFGVTDKAIEKWCKDYQIEKPYRGYWIRKNVI